MIVYKFSLVFSFDQISYLFLQLKTLHCIMDMISMKLIIFVLVSVERVSLDLSRPFHKLLVLDLHEYLGNGGIERR